MFVNLHIYLLVHDLCLQQIAVTSLHLLTHSLIMVHPSILRLIRPDLTNLVLLHPISAITQTIAFPHFLFTNGLSLLW